MNRPAVITLLCVSFVALATGAGFFSEFLGDSVAPARDLALAVAFGLIAVLGWGLVYGLIVRGRAKERALKSADHESQTLIAVYAPIREGLTALAFGVLSLALSLAVAHRRGIPGSWEERPGVESTLSFGLLLAVAASLIGGVICAIHFFASVEEVGLSPAPEIPVVRPSGIGFWLPYVLSGALAIQLIEGSVEDDAQTVFAIFGESPSFSYSAA